MNYRQIHILTFIVIVLSISVVPVFAGTITVSNFDDAGTGCTLREAIAEANAVGAGGASLANGCSGATVGVNTISLPPGTYTIGSELPIITTTLTIQPTTGTRVTIRANASPNTATYRVMRVTGASGNLTLQDLTIRNGGNLTSAINGGCLRADSDSSLSIVNVIIDNCRSRVGGGISALNATLSVSGGSIIQNNLSSDDSGGIDIERSSVTITDSTIRDNQNINTSRGGAGGGLTAMDATSFTVSGSTFMNNSVGTEVGGNGGAIYFSGFSGITGSISNSSFIDNQATGAANTNGGAIYHTGVDPLNISTSRFENNMADNLGDAIYHGSSGAMSITGSCFTNNGDIAIFDTANGSFVVANGGGNIANANWWGSSWGPRIPALGASAGSYYSTGDSINGNGATAVSNQLVNVGLTNPGDGATAPTGAWLTAAPVVAGELCATKGAASTGAGLNVTVLFQGRPPAPNTRLIVPLTVMLVPTAGGAAVIDTPLSTDEDGVLPLLSAHSGSYTLWVKGEHTLAHSQAVDLTVGSNDLTLSDALLEGDADNDNTVTLPDFSLLASAFGTSLGDPAYDESADFNGDDAVTLVDFSLLASNFGGTGATVP